MSRKPRRFRPSTFQHIISRFLDRDFKLEDQRDRDAYFRYLSDAQKLWDWVMLSFALMSSHVHLGAIAGIIEPDKAFRSTHIRFAQYWHRRYGGLGPVFADRPANHEIRTSRIAKLILYHHRNPVDAGAVLAPEDCRWTSHRYYLRLETPPDWLDVEQGLALCGFSDTAADRKRFDDFIRSADASEYSEESGLWLPAKTEEEALIVPSQERLCLKSLAILVANVCGVDGSEIRRRARPTCTTRLIFVEAARVLGASHDQIATELGVSRAAIGRIVERNRSRLDGLMPVVEEIIRAWYRESAALQLCG